MAQVADKLARKSKARSRNAQKKQNAKREMQPVKMENSKGQKKKRQNCKKGAKAEEVYYCTLCRGRYGDEFHAKGTEDWIDCCTCKKWYHESCAEESGILDDDVFTCRMCFE